MNVHTYPTTGEAYDACQTGLPNNEVLLIPFEGVVGISGTWPIAVTVSHGQLHTAAWEVVKAVDFATACALYATTSEAVLTAAKLARESGWALDPGWAEYLRKV